MIPGRIIEQDSAECHHKNDNSNTTTTTTACLHFAVMSPDPYFSSLWFPEHNSTTINISVVLGQCGVLHARMTTLLIFAFYYVP